MSDPTEGPMTTTPPEAAGNQRLAVLLAMAMFVLVVDTSLMNVSISSVVRGPRHDRQRRAVGDRPRGAGVRRVHPDRQQDRRSLRSQAGVRAGPPRLRRRRAGDGARPEPDRDHHLLGDPRRARRVAAAARHAVADPRQLRRSRTEEGLRAGRRGGGDRRRGRTAARRLHHDLPLVARRVPARGGRDRDRAVRHRARPRRAVHRGRAASTSSVPSCRWSAWAASCSGILVWQEGGEVRWRAAGRSARSRSRSLAYWLVRRKRDGKPDAARPRSCSGPSRSGSGSPSR